MNRFGTQQLLLPVKPWFMWISLSLGLVLNLLPLGPWIYRPDVLLVLLVFWSMQQPSRLGIGTAFLCGLLMDAHQGVLLGQHALTYCVLVYWAIMAHRRVLWFGLFAQTLYVFPLFLLGRLIILALRLISGGDFPGLSWMLAAFIETLLWPVLTLVLLAPQRLPPDPDSNRPL